VRISCVGIVPGALDYDDNPVPAGVVRNRQIRLKPDYFLDQVLDDLDGPGALENGDCHLISAVGQHIAPMTVLATPVVTEKSVVVTRDAVATTTCASPILVESAAQGNSKKEIALANLSQTFRRVFSLPPETDLRGLGTNNLRNWDSLGQLKLLMEVEQALEIRIPTDKVASITTFEALCDAVISAV
jgi:acyl carrier protein